MALRTAYNGAGGTGYFREPIIMVPPSPPELIQPIGTDYGENPDWLDPKPIRCMRSWPPGIYNIQAQLCRPNKAELARRELEGRVQIQICPPACPVDWPLGKRPPVTIIEETNGAGETVKVARDEDGDVIATKKVPPNIMPLALVAAAAFFFLA